MATAVSILVATSVTTAAVVVLPISQFCSALDIVGAVIIVASVVVVAVVGMPVMVLASAAVMAEYF